MEYKSYKYIPVGDRKYFPFSNKGQPDKYDEYLLIKKTEKVDSTSGTVKWENIASNTIDSNNTGDFTCNIHARTSEAVYWSDSNGGPICQLFEFINTRENSDSNWKTCPTKMDELKPISLKGKTKESFPNLFLFAVKYNKSELAGKNHGHSEIFVGNDGQEGKKLMTIYTNNAQSSDYVKCTFN